MFFLLEIELKICGSVPARGAIKAAGLRGLRLRYRACENYAKD